ncbi:MAG: hypothetical protein JWR83_3351 [Aeromicrobium sp.]|nr:hypothetical protein [Aeromicrobium sp.]
MPAEIYWRRRLLALAVVIAVVWGILQVTGGDDKATTTPTATATATPTPTPTVAPVDGIVKVSLVTATRACDPEKIRITPTVEPGQHTKAAVSIGLVVSSTETTACTLDPADADLVAVISANKTPIWDSTVCKTSLLTTPVAISPRWASLVDTTWSGRGSGGKCAKKEGYATPGKYVIQAGTLGGEPGKTTFTITAAPRPKVTTTPTTPTKTPTAKKTTAKPTH